MSTAVILGLAAGGLLAGVSETGGAAPAGLRPANAALLLLSRSSLKGNIQPVG